MDGLVTTGAPCGAWELLPQGAVAAVEGQRSVRRQVAHNGKRLSDTSDRPDLHCRKLSIQLPVFFNRFGSILEWEVFFLKTFSSLNSFLLTTDFNFLLIYSFFYSLQDPFLNTLVTFTQTQQPFMWAKLSIYIYIYIYIFSDYIYQITLIVFSLRNHHNLNYMDLLANLQLKVYKDKQLFLNHFSILFIVQQNWLRLTKALSAYKSICTFTYIYIYIFQNC